MTKLLCRHGIERQGSILPAIAEHLLGIAFGVVGTHIDDPACFIIDQLESWVHEALVGSYMQLLVAG